MTAALPVPTTTWPRSGVHHFHPGTFPGQPAFPLPSCTRASLLLGRMNTQLLMLLLPVLGPPIIVRPQIVILLHSMSLKVESKSTHGLLRFCVEPAWIIFDPEKKLPTHPPANAVEVTGGVWES